MTAIPQKEPRIRREQVDLEGYDLVSVSFCANGEVLSSLEFDRLSESPKFTFITRGTTVACDA